MDDKVLEELNVAFVSIGQKYGFVSAGDVFRQRLAEASKTALGKGKAEGLSKGILQEKLSLAKGFLKEGIPIKTIAKVTGLSIDEIKAL